MPNARAGGLVPKAGRIVLLCGASGSGKTSLLRQLRSAGAGRGIRWIDLNRVELPPARRLIDFFPEQTTERTLQALARVGLADAWCFLRTPRQLSEGQRWRLKLAVAMHRAARWGESQRARRSRRQRQRQRAIVVCDEFAALLDRVTAAIVARGLRRWIDASPAVAALVATSHGDIVDALQPDRIIQCDFYGQPTVNGAAQRA